METENNRKYVMKSVIELFILIDRLIDVKEGIGLTQLCKYMRLTKNKTFRMLATLEFCGIVDKDQQNNYRLGIATTGIARRMLAKASMLDNVRPKVEGLVKLFNEDVYIAYSRDGKAVLVDYVECCRPIKATSFVGRTLQPLASTNLVNGNSLTKIEDITVDIGGLDQDITTVSMSIRNVKGVVTGTLVVLAPTFRMSMDRIKTEIAPALREVMREQSSLISGISKDISKLSEYPVCGHMESFL